MSLGDFDWDFQYTTFISDEDWTSHEMNTR